MIGIYRLKPQKDTILKDLSAQLIRCGVSANQVTFAGLCLGIMAAPFLWMKLYSLGLLLIFLSVFLDMLDGTLARLSGTHSLFGKLFDALSDRATEASWVGALFFNGMLPWWGWFIPIASIGLLLARYIAYCQDLETTFVPITRFERVTAIIGVILIPAHAISRFIYLFVCGGTLFSILMIIFVMFYRNTGCDSKGILLTSVRFGQRNRFTNDCRNHR